MNIQTCNEPEVMARLLAALDLTGKITPEPPHNSCSGILKLDGDAFLIIENNAGRFTMHLLEGFTKQQAYAHFDKLNGMRSNPRLVFCRPLNGSQEPSPIHN